MKKEIKITNSAIEVYNKFKSKTGSCSIAGLPTIELFLQICKTMKPERILEMSGGIGTISWTILNNSEAFLDIYEPNEFCQEQLKINLSAFAGRYNIINDYRVLPPVREYDCLIVDGGGGKGGDVGFSDSVWFYISYLRSIKIVYIEGFRRVQSFFARKALAQKYIYRLKKYDTLSWQGELLSGGLLIECVPCKSKILRWINFIFWEFVKWTRIKSFVVNRLNKLKSIILGK